MVHGNPTLRFMALVLVATAMCTQALAQTFPNKPVHLISQFPAGSGPDAALRALATQLSGTWKQTVVVDPRPGGAGFIAAEAVKGGSTEGYDLLVADKGFVAVNPTLYKKFPFDFERDFETASPFFINPFYIVVGYSSNISSAGDLTAMAKARPGSVAYGSPRVGSPSHLGSALYESRTGTRMIHVPFTETNQMWQAISSGDVAWAFGSLASTRAFVESKKIRLVAVAAKNRDPARPDIPTVSEAGGPADFEVDSWVAMFARKGTPKETLDKINQDVAQALTTPDVRKFFENFAYTPYAIGRADFAKVLKEDTKVNHDLVIQAGATAD